jgi:bifunctional non-homologous end joining protein LigD
MLLNLRDLPAGFIEPCLPTSAPSPPSGELYIHEIKHDGFRLIARKNDNRVRLYSRSGNDLTERFALIVEAMAALAARSCLIDGEAVACGDDGIASFDRIRYRHYDETVFLYAFDLIELNGEDLRREPFVVRKTTLASLLGQEMLAGLLGSAVPGLRFNEHIEADGPTVFQQACKLGLEGIVSKRKDSRYVSGQPLHWIKSKNPKCAGSEARGRDRVGSLSRNRVKNFPSGA